MAVTKIHPIEKTLHLALNHIMNADKTDEKILVSSFNCNPKLAHLEFEQTKRECNSKAKILARHLIQFKLIVHRQLHFYDVKKR